MIFPMLLRLNAFGAASLVPWNGTATWNAMQVKTYEHVDGVAGGRTLLGEWSNPFNTSYNILCILGGVDASCPTQCSNTTGRVSKKRVRKSLAKMPEHEWQKVVRALTSRSSK